jgi:thioredoxin 1
MGILTITKDNFEIEVIQSDTPFLLDFWAPWCDTCKAVSPVVDEIANEATGFKVGKINIDEQKELAATYKIEKVPTLSIVKEGRFKKSVVGAKQKEEILDMINT